MTDFEELAITLLEEIRDTQKKTLEFFKSIEESSLGEIDSQKYLDELGKDKFHPPMG
jgi:hypothetical protein